METSQILETIQEVTERTLKELKNLDYENLPIADLIKILNGCTSLQKSLEQTAEDDEIEKLWAEMQAEKDNKKEKEKLKNEKTQN